MTRTIEDLTQGAIELPPDQRFTLARRILASIEPDANPEIDTAWDVEIRARIKRYDIGETTGLSGSAVFAGIDRLLAHEP